MLRIAILGRPNVGKSSLFNRLCKRSLAIVNAQEGTTRDRLYGTAELYGTDVQFIDTGGINKYSDDLFQKHIYKQALVAAEEADLLLFVIDIRCGITEQDALLASSLRRLHKPIILIANKADTAKDEHAVHQLYSLGIEHIHVTSAAHDRHIDSLFERIRCLANIPLPAETDKDEQDDEIMEIEEANITEASFELEDGELCHEEISLRPESQHLGPTKIALIGRPNVGKSSIVNALLNEERCIIDNIPGTTRDNVDILYSHGDCEYLFIDTAGLRKMKSVKNSIEWISSSRTEKAIIRSHLCLLIIDAIHRLTSYDKRILSLIFKHKKPHIILVNKWDLVPNVRMEHYIRDLRAMDPYIGQAKIVCISAKTRRNLPKIFSSIEELRAIVTNKIATSLVNKTLATALQKHPPQVINNRRLRVYYAIHKTSEPFSFLLFINSKSLVTKHYELYLKNTLKTSFNLFGVPFELEFKEKEKR